MLERLREDVAVVALSSRIAFDRLRAAEVRLLAIPRADNRGGRDVDDWPILRMELRVFSELGQSNMRGRLPQRTSVLKGLVVLCVKR